VIKPNGKKEHQEGEHDDCVFGLALAETGRRIITRRRSEREELRGSKATPYGKRRDEDDD
jgi:hypothetical protein